MASRPDDIASLLRQHGFKVTRPRREVLRVISTTSEHLSPGEIYERVRARHSTIGRVSVYRTLDMLTRLGLLCEVHLDGSCRTYLMRRPGEHHHHLICSGCGTVVDFPECEVAALQANLSRRTGFKIESHLLEFSGKCRHCQQNGREQTSA